jgi:hypothetical protein
VPGATAEINSVAYSRIHWKYFQKVGEYNGVKLLAVWTHGPGHMFNTKRPINSLADLKGMKIRTGGGIAEKFGNLLGASAFVKPAPESYELLSSGVADGVFFPLESVVSFKLDKVLKYATVFPGRLLQLVVRLLHEPGQVGEDSEAGPGHHREDGGRGSRAQLRKVVGHRGPGRAGYPEESGSQDRHRKPRVRQ